MTGPPRPHALVVGGTGMLVGAVLGLADRGFAVTVVARSRARLEALAKKADRGRARAGAVHPLAADYGEDAAFRARLAGAVSLRGPLHLAVCWIHGDGSPALGAVAEVLATGVRPSGVPGLVRPRLVELRGSALRDPSSPRPTRDAAVRAWPEVDHEVVLLGYVSEPPAGRPRWLTDREIATGVLEAVERPAPTRAIGVVVPWGGRPGGAG